MLAIARGLLASPRLLLLDEPSLGLAPQMVDEVFALEETIQADGITSCWWSRTPCGRWRSPTARTSWRPDRSS